MGVLLLFLFVCFSEGGGVTVIVYDIVDHEFDHKCDLDLHPRSGQKLFSLDWKTNTKI